MYARSLGFMLYKATQDLFPGSKLNMEHPISKGVYCRIKKSDGKALDDNDIAALRVRMRAIVADDIQFHRHEARIDDAISMFSKLGQEDKVKLLETSGKAYTDYYTLDDVPYVLIVRCFSIRFRDQLSAKIQLFHNMQVSLRKITKNNVTMSKITIFVPLLMNRVKGGP